MSDVAGAEADDVVARPGEALDDAGKLRLAGQRNDLPVAAGVERLSRWIGLLQQGRIAVYLLYSFLTLVAVLLQVDALTHSPAAVGLIGSSRDAQRAFTSFIARQHPTFEGK